MANYNRVILAGNLTRDPQLSMLPSNTPVCEFGMAINRKWKSQTGEMREDTCFVDLAAYGRRAETLNQYMSKGRPLLVEGRLQYRQWEAKDGGKRSKLTVVVENFQFLGGGGGSGGGGGGGDQSRYMPERAAAPSGAAAGPGEMPPPSQEPQHDSDIPF